VEEEGDPPPLVLLGCEDLLGLLTVGFVADRGSRG
jgi:hypothetical protein